LRYVGIELWQVFISPYLLSISDQSTQWQKTLFYARWNLEPCLTMSWSLTTPSTQSRWLKKHGESRKMYVAFLIEVKSSKVEPFDDIDWWHYWILQAEKAAFEELEKKRDEEVLSWSCVAWKIMWMFCNLQEMYIGLLCRFRFFFLNETILDVMWERTDFIYFFHVVSCSCMLKLLK
jgi:hypothetical protein